MGNEAFKAAEMGIENAAEALKEYCG